MEQIFKDIRFAARGLRRRPGFSLLAVVTLALAIGANATLFSAVQAVLLSSPPYPEPERVVRIWGSSPAGGWLRGAVSPQNAFDLARANRSLRTVGWFTMRSGNLLAAGRPRSVEFALVTPGLLEALRMAPAAGRLFAEEENAPGSDNVVLISHRLWMGVFNGEPGVVGRSVTLNDRQLIVAGVMPADFRFPGPETDLWKPFGMTPDDGGERAASWVYAVGRLDDGVSLEQAREDVARVARDLEAAYPDANSNRSFFLETLHAAETRGVRDALLLLWGAVGLILLIACVNITNLLLARGAARRREFSVRAVLGASPRRVVQLLLTECLLLAGLATAAGLAVAAAGSRILTWLAAGRLPRVEAIGVDGTVILFSVGLALATTLVFGLAPAANARRLSLGDALRDRGEGRYGRLRFVLVAAQVCLALVLLTGAGLMLRSFQTLLSVDLGFDPDRLYTFRVEPPMAASGVGASFEEFLASYEKERRLVSTFYRDLLNELGAIEGVAAVGAINRRPLSGNMWQTSIAISGRPVERREDLLPSTARNVTADYFSTVDVALLRGRTFDDRDRGGAPLAVVINRTMAEAYWPGQDPVGERISFMYPPREGFWLTVVGVVDDVRHVDLSVDPIPLFYVPLEQAYFGFFGDWGMDVMVRTRGEVDALAESVQAALARVDPRLPVASFQTMGQVMGDNASSQRFSLSLLGLFAGLALVLAFVGIYGVISYTTEQRRREFGTRAALGARPADILGLVARHGAGVTLAGVGAGLLLSLALSGTIAGLLYQVSPMDPVTLVATALLMTGLGVGAALLPAWRAGRADPLETLRAD